jgi:hypothetical protein
VTAQTAGQSRRTRARIAASVAVLGAAAGVAGLGTFGTFTDSTTPVISRTDTGVLSIALTEAAHTATLSLFDQGVFLAGDVPRHYAGPIVTDVALSGGAALAPGGTEHLLLTAGLPATTTADLVEGATSSLDFVFSGTQRDGVAR